MEPSRRTRSIVPDGDGWAILDAVAEARAAGRRVVNLTLGEHDRPTDPRILDAMHASARGGNTGYAPVPGSPALRAAVAARVESRTGVPTAPENVLVTPGGQAALFAALVTAADPGQTAAIVAPYYATYPGTVRAAGLLLAEIHARPEDGFLPRPEALPPARALLLNTPNNPTGALYPASLLAALGEAHRGWIVSDEVYDGQVWEGAHASPRAVPGLSERTLVVGSMSKGHAMTGSRIGWLVGPAEAIAAARDLATHTTYGVAGFVQDAALHALGLGPAFEDGIAAPFRRRRDLALRVLSGRSGVRLGPSPATMYVMADIRPTGLSGRGFADRLLKRAGVAVMPGESFGAPTAGHVRIALTAEDAALGAALEALADMADALAREAA
jgi:arginine:pyruvate transaminase